jgi:predicted RNA binding protein YcfA (HicA-like mRNA interferase family)
VPRLICTFAQVIAILESNGFELHRQGATSHRRYRKEAGGMVYLVDVAPHGMNAVVPMGTLLSIIRQSGLPKSMFRK